MAKGTKAAKVADETGTETAVGRVLPSDPAAAAVDAAQSAWIESKGKVTASGDARNEACRVFYMAVCNWAIVNATVTKDTIMAKRKTAEKLAESTVTKETSQWATIIGAARKNPERVLKLWPQRIVDANGETTQATITVEEFRSLCSRILSPQADDGNADDAELLKRVRKAKREKAARDKVDNAKETLADAGMGVAVDVNAAPLAMLRETIKAAANAVLSRFPEHEATALEIMRHMAKLRVIEQAPPAPANDATDQKAA